MHSHTFVPGEGPQLCRFPCWDHWSHEGSRPSLTDEHHRFPEHDLVDGSCCTHRESRWYFPSIVGISIWTRRYFICFCRFPSPIINGKLKLFSDLAPGVLDLVTVLTPLLLASLISGIAMCYTLSDICGYRLRYAAIIDFRVNHIPLKTIPLAQAHDRLGDCEKLSLRRWVIKI